MTDSNETDRATRTLDAAERRVLGVLIEKAKTTPDAYPLSLNALRSGCNQKSNRFPQSDYDDDRLEQTLDALRSKGAVTVVQGDSRVERYRHRAYEWLGLEKVELAVVAELLLRGAQTVGDLRGRAARMEPIKGIAELTPVLGELVQKGWVEYLSPPGRGAIVSHTFYSQSELERVRRDLGLGASSAGGSAPASPAPSSERPAEVRPPAPGGPPAGGVDGQVASLREELRAEIDELRDEVERLKRLVDGC